MIFAAELDPASDKVYKSITDLGFSALRVDDFNRATLEEKCGVAGVPQAALGLF